MPSEDVALNIVVPMAGRGSRFTQASHTTPKPLIPMNGKPMIQWVIENIRPQRSHRFIFICQREHLESYPEVSRMLQSLCPGCVILTLNEVTDGAACTVLTARDLIDYESPLMIANSDQYVELDINDYLAVGDSPDIDALIMTFWSDHPKWSYCRMRPDGTVSEVVEKEVVSNEATVGIYNFRRGCDFVRAADRMIEMDLRVNNEFYVAPTYNQLIDRGGRVITKNIGKDRDGMYGLGVPEDLEFFMKTKIYKDLSSAL